MSRDNLGNKQTIILHSCIINNERYDLVITTPRQTIVYIRTKRQTLRKKLSANKNKLSGNDLQSEETQSQNQKQVKYNNSTI